MKKALLLFAFFSQALCAQNSEAYSDADILNYIRINEKFLEFKMQQVNYAQRMQADLQIDQIQMESTLDALRKAGSWKSLKDDLDPDFATRFDSLMTYRATLKLRLKDFMQKELEAVNWTTDYFEHFKLTLEADPALQARLIELSKTTKP